jgi:hypothetical protein
LHDNLPCAAEQIEVVDIVATERRLQRLEDVARQNAQCLRLVAIDRQIDVETFGQVGRSEDPAVTEPRFQARV